MKKSIKRMAIGITALACACMMAACGENPQGTDDQNPDGSPETLAQQQISLAKNTYNAFYSKDELFSSQSARAVKASAALGENGEGEESGVTFSDVRNALAGYHWAAQNNLKVTFNSYVADIFSYSQVQSSIIEEFGEDALTDVYALDYSNVNWSSDTTGQGAWIQSTKLLSAAFAGADLESGNVYCTQAHKSQGVLVLANLEYYYDSDDNMGVTTLNWHSNGRFEYHYCSAGTYEILQAFGTYNQNGDITLTDFSIFQQNSVLGSYSCSASDKALVYDYVLSEVARINGKIDDLQEQNERERNLDGTEDADGEETHVGVCSVNFDFAILSRMLIK